MLRMRRQNKLFYRSNNYHLFGVCKRKGGIATSNKDPQPICAPTFVSLALPALVDPSLLFGLLHRLLAFLDFAKGSLSGSRADFGPLVAALLDLINVKTHDGARNLDFAAATAERMLILDALLVEPPPRERPHKLRGLLFLVVHRFSLGGTERNGLTIPAYELAAVTGVDAMFAESAQLSLDDHFVVELFLSKRRKQHNKRKYLNYF